MSQKIVIGQLRSYPVAKPEVTELAGVKHVFVKASARVNNRAPNSHQPTRRRERHMQGFRDPQRTQTFLSRFGPALRLAPAPDEGGPAIVHNSRRVCMRWAGEHFIAEN